MLDTIARTAARMAVPVLLLCIFASGASARSVYDGWWSLTFLTRNGGCDPSYNFTVQIRNGIVTHPNLVKFRGRVYSGGAVRASVTVHDKHATGSGRLSRNRGQGRWAGYSGSARCSGLWTATRA